MPGFKGVEVEVLTDDPELRREAKPCAAFFVHEDIVTSLEERISSWPRLKRIVALVLCFKKKALDCIRGKSSTKELDHTRQHSVPLDLEGIKMAEDVIRSVQRRHFGEELISLGKGKCLKSCSSIVKLDPFIDDEGILRVGGRIKRSAVAIEMQHLVVLPKSSRIAELVVRWCHGQVAHAGQGMAMNQIRSSGFWVTRCKSLVRYIILKCVRCKQLRRRLQQQKMADLPKERMSEEPPFTYCGVDLFGSFLVKDGWKEVKTYGALYTCLSSRAICLFVKGEIPECSPTLTLKMMARFTVTGSNASTTCKLINNVRV